MGVHPTLMCPERAATNSQDGPRERPAQQPEYRLIGNLASDTECPVLAEPV